MRSARTGCSGRTATAAAVFGMLIAASVSPASADTIRSRQWHLDAMHAEEMWETSKGTGITVAVIDTGVDANLPDLQGQVLEGENFSGNEGTARTDTDGHGTHMAALIAGTGKRGSEFGAYGLAPGAKILPVRVGGSNFRDDSLAMAKALRYAADSDARIINISRGSPGRNAEEEEAITYALSKGKLIFVAVGNTGDKSNAVEYPAAFPGVLGVAAVDQNGTAASWSQHGPQVALAAPGVGMVAACPGDSGVCRGDGTSAATAIASASAALIWSVHPTWTANQITRVLINTAGGPENGKKRTDLIGYGAVRPRIALKDPGDPGPADVSPLPGPESKSAAGKVQKQAAAPKDDDGLNATWIAVGIGAAALLGAAITTPILIARRRGI
ncbi:type VII secretion-associated serine protease mycosin [Streptomyces blastmyceticus]|uniref:Type VII secretion-associated serine protease mycosin n=1 Tax=Streptomyces blastmyceticus TaxID=68180 RepID=A0ABN0WAW2_9ACTN